MVMWYGLQLIVRGGEARKLLYSYLILFSVGACLYGVVPALGPRYVFGASFPAGHPVFTAIPTLLEGYPNAMPSLHVATALLLVAFSAHNRWLLSVSLVFLAITVAATLALEHYVVDLVVAMPFAWFAVELSHRRMKNAAKYLTLVLMWLGLIRFTSSTLVGHPWLLRALALFTIGVAVRAFALQWRDAKEVIVGELEPALA